MRPGPAGVTDDAIRLLVLLPLCVDMFSMMPAFLKAMIWPTLVWPPVTVQVYALDSLPVAVFVKM
jgi:hypothetical protein